MFIHVYATTTQILCFLCSLSFYLCRAWCMKGTCILSLSIYFLTGILQGACIHPLSVYFCSGVWQGGVFISIHIFNKYSAKACIHPLFFYFCSGAWQGRVFINRLWRIVLVNFLESFGGFLGIFFWGGGIKKGNKCHYTLKSNSFWRNGALSSFQIVVPKARSPING